MRPYSDGVSLSNDKVLAILGHDADYSLLLAYCKQTGLIPSYVDILSIWSLSKEALRHSSDMGFGRVRALELLLGKSEYQCVAWIPSQHMLTPYFDLVERLKVPQRILFTDGLRNIGLRRESSFPVKDKLVSFLHEDVEYESWFSMSGSPHSGLERLAVTDESLSAALRDLVRTSLGRSPKVSSALFHSQDLLIVHRGGWKNSDLEQIKLGLKALIQRDASISRVILKGPRLEGQMSEKEWGNHLGFEDLEIEIVPWSDITSEFNLPPWLCSPEFLFAYELYGLPGKVFAFEGTTGLISTSLGKMETIPLTEVVREINCSEEATLRIQQSDWLSSLTKRNSHSSLHPDRSKFLDHEFKALELQLREINLRYKALGKLSTFMVRIALGKLINAYGNLKKFYTLGGKSGHNYFILRG